jgi:hypothetical protein
MNLDQNAKTLFRDKSGEFTDLLDDTTKDPLTLRHLILTALRKKTEQSDCESETLDARFELMEKVATAKDEIEFSKLELAEIKKAAAVMFDAMVYGCLIRELNK